MKLTEILIGWPTEDWLTHYGQRGMKLHFLCFGKNGIPVHEVRHA